jgi:PRTRC genetic system protein B
MEGRVSIGANRNFILKNAVLVYGDGTTAFATLHPVVSKSSDQTPYLGPGQALTSAFLKTLAAELGARIAPEVLPTNVLARTPDMITWWTRARREVMFFGGADQKARELNGAVYPQPALVFKVTDRELFVRALEKDERPADDTLLKTAPYWNVDSTGRIWLGTMCVPDEVAVASMTGWEAGFFRSEFTHPNGAVRLSSHPHGFFGLWKGLKNSESAFPVEFLTAANETLRQFVERG